MMMTSYFPLRIASQSLSHGVDAAVHLRLVVERVEVRDNRLLMGNRDIVAVELFQSIAVLRFEPLGSDIERGIVRVDARERKEPLVDKRRHGVTDGVADDGVVLG